MEKKSIALKDERYDDLDRIAHAAKGNALAVGDQEAVDAAGVLRAAAKARDRGESAALVARYVYGIEPMDATTNAEGHLLVDFQLGANGAPVFELAPEKRNDDFGLVVSILWSRTFSPWVTVDEIPFSAEDGDMLCRPPVNTSTEPCMFFKWGMDVTE